VEETIGNKMGKAELISTLSTGRGDFLKLLQGLSDQQMEIPVIVERWSIKDLLVHLTRWEAEIIKLVWQAKQGIKPTTAHFMKTSMDDLNKSWYEESRSRALKLVMDDFQGVREQTIRRVKDISETALTNPKQYTWLQGKPLWVWIAEDSFEHEAEHGEQIINWLSIQG
jgi:hypothetical protein